MGRRMRFRNDDIKGTHEDTGMCDSTSCEPVDESPTATEHYRNMWIKAEARAVRTEGKLRRMAVSRQAAEDELESLRHTPPPAVDHEHENCVPLWEAERLKRQPRGNVTALYRRVTELERQVDELYRARYGR